MKGADEFLHTLVSELLRLKFYEKNNDLYQFHQVSGKVRGCACEWGKKWLFMCGHRRKGLSMCEKELGKEGVNMNQHVWVGWKGLCKYV